MKITSVNMSRDVQVNENLHTLEERMAFRKMKNKKAARQDISPNASHQVILKNEYNYFAIPKKDTGTSHARNIVRDKLTGHSVLGKSVSCPLEAESLNLKGLNKVEEKFYPELSSKENVVVEKRKNEPVVKMIEKVSVQETTGKIDTQQTQQEVKNQIGVDSAFSTMSKDVDMKKSQARREFLNPDSSNLYFNKTEVNQNAKIIGSEKTILDNFDYIKAPRLKATNATKLDVVKSSDNFPIIYNFQKMPVGNSVGINLTKGKLTLIPSSEPVQRLLNQKKSSISNNIKYSLGPAES